MLGIIFLIVIRLLENNFGIVINFFQKQNYI